MIAAVCGLKWSRHLGCIVMPSTDPLAPSEGLRGSAAECTFRFDIRLVGDTPRWSISFTIPNQTKTACSGVDMTPHTRSIAIFARLRLIDVDATTHAAFAIDDLAALSCAHPRAEAALAFAFDLADSVWVMHLYTRLSVITVFVFANFEPGSMTDRRPRAKWRVFVP